MRNKLLIRLQNPRVIIGITSGTLMILVNLEIISVDFSNQIIELINILLSIGVSIGILANPESHVKENHIEDRSHE